MDSEDEVNSNDFNGHNRLNKPYKLQVILPKWSKKKPKSATTDATTFMKSYAYSFDKARVADFSKWDFPAFFYLSV